MKRFVAVLMACLMLFSITGFALAEELSISVDFIAIVWDDPEYLSTAKFLEGVEIFIIRDGVVVSTLFTNIGGHANYMLAIPGTYEVEIRVPDGHALHVWSHDERSEADGIVSIYPRSTRFSLGEFSPDTPYSSVIASLTFVESETTATPFTDVAADRWYTEAVQFVADNRLMRGTGGNQFSPHTNLTRGMLATILHRYAGEPAVTVPNPFSDVASGQWYTDPVIWAADNGMMMGHDGRFRPGDNITREELATIFFRFGNSDYGYDWDVGDVPVFGDSALVSEWAVDAVGALAYNGIIQGTPDGRFNPLNSATRAEVAIMMQRLVTLWA